VIAPADLDGEAPALPGGGVPNRIRGQLNRYCHRVVAGRASRQQPGQPTANVPKFGAPAAEAAVPLVRGRETERRQDPYRRGFGGHYLSAIT
jgi:hypothetical protein